MAQLEFKIGNMSLSKYTMFESQGVGLLFPVVSVGLVVGLIISALCWQASNITKKMKTVSDVSSIFFIILILFILD
jgi:hypothetical protein